MLHFVGYATVGLIIGTFGTIIGVGGGFLLVPLLLWLYPTAEPEVLAGISLTAVFFNAFSGSLAYARLKRIDYRSGLTFSLAALPGTILGSLSTTYIPRHLFDAVIGLLLLAASSYIVVRPNREKALRGGAVAGHTTVVLTDASGAQYRYAYNRRIGVGISFFVGYFSSLLGIGGGVIHVPALIQILNFPVHIGTATSHFILAVMTFAGSATHIVIGTLADSLRIILPISLGMIVGAQIGARLSGRVRGTWITRSLAVALMLVGIRTLWQAFK
ncbi:MAG TPA: sulfite exporter TauE/SafE family protein [candidate division Zixibacteria bacterium]|nr:sulfite exporter TauE/SafE family protein [candidate division Zixibacteria bacterium]MDD4916985.1 sulfite exporter TauE/SafE family protein [candidate division Zixibacteria bacterium]MDM7972624.1 sulfite exporter TauE/SafE family protein [candidate division Zixibacteria bacterium]HOD67009.1 sulfite exporter TauE/SafE family protein [candidate division Zixibacteria bacterium]HOZ08309.1 sulfite exporter TauE/SafE family protein [candidate division Zixibacteria bacterium]